MTHALQFYIDATWVDPVVPDRFPVIDPSEVEGILGYAAA